MWIFRYSTWRSGDSDTGMVSTTTAGINVGEAALAVLAALAAFALSSVVRTIRCRRIPKTAGGSAGAGC
jgi:hypothetical protein